MTSGPIRILIADDCVISRRVEELILRRSGYEVSLAADGIEAVDKARSQPPDLILLDLEMPRLGGLEALKELKGSSLSRHVPVIVVTTQGDPASRDAARESGCDGFLTKPFEAEVLVRMIERNLAPSRRGRSMFQAAGETP